MKAIRTHLRGGAEQLVYKEPPVPALEPGCSCPYLVAKMASASAKLRGCCNIHEKRKDNYEC